MKALLYVLGAVVLAIAVTPLFLPSHFEMVRSIEVQAPASTVFSRLSDLNDFKEWNPFDDTDPTSKSEVSGTGVGSSMSWKGEETGVGKMTVAKIEPDKTIDIKMDFIEPMKAEAMAYWTVSAANEGKTLVMWSYAQDLPYFNRYFGMIMERMLGPAFETGLANFKARTESAVPAAEPPAPTESN